MKQQSFASMSYQAKNPAQVFTLIGLTNLYMNRRALAT